MKLSALSPLVSHSHQFQYFKILLSDWFHGPQPSTTKRLVISTYLLGSKVFSFSKLAKAFNTFQTLALYLPESPGRNI